MSSQQKRYPQPPVNVKVLHKAGGYTAVECIYGERDDKGVDHWYSVRPVPFVDGADEVTVDELPEGTQVHLVRPSDTRGAHE